MIKVSIIVGGSWYGDKLIACFGWKRAALPKNSVSKVYAADAWTMSK